MQTAGAMVCAFHGARGSRRGVEVLAPCAFHGARGARRGVEVWHHRTCGPGTCSPVSPVSSISESSHEGRGALRESRPSDLESWTTSDQGTAQFRTSNVRMPTAFDNSLTNRSICMVDELTVMRCNLHSMRLDDAESLRTAWSQITGVWI